MTTSKILPSSEEHYIGEDFKEAEEWARGVLGSKYGFLILDTETTGLGNAEIVDIAVLNRYGQPLLSQKVKPTIPIPSDSTRIHNITDEMVATAPTFPDIYPQLKELLEGRKVIIYNSGFDTNIIDYCCKLHDLEPIAYHPECAMLGC